MGTYGLGMFLGGGFRPLEMIDTSSINQETYQYFSQQVSFLVYKCHNASGEEFYLPRG
jgi:hypothetical protein